MSKKFVSIAAIVICLVLFVALNIVGAKLLRGARIDLTENRLYTLSEGSRSIASKIDEPIKLTMYLSEKQANSLPDVKTYSTRVREFLREFADASGGKIRLEVVDPEPFSEAEDKANAAGLYAMPVGGAERLYFGLAGSNSTDRTETIAFFDPRKEQFLEYDISRLIYVLSNPQKKTIGILASLPINGVQDNPMMRGQDSPPWQIAAQLKDLFDVKNIATDAAEIPADIKVLLVVHPKNLTDKTLYAIDQYVLRGGSLIVFVDPWSDADLPPGINPMQAMGMPRNSDLAKLFAAWGVEMVPERFAADRDGALSVTIGTQIRPERVDYLAWLTLSRAKGNLASAEPVTGQLETINVGTAGVLQKKPDATTTFEPLLQTGPNSMLMDIKSVQLVPDPKKLLSEFQPGGKPLTIAARVSGKVKTAFPGGDPAKPAPAEGQPAPADNSLTEGNANIIIVADTDMLSDRFWVGENRMGNLLLGYSKFADNGDFVVRAADNLSGSGDLMSLRARGKFYRPFERVDAIRKEAEDKYLAEERRLREEYTKADTKINELLRQAPHGSAVILTPEVQAEIDRLRNEKVAINKNLRNVSHQMRKDIEQLGTRLKILNIALVPIVVGVLAVVLSLYRANRRRTIRAAAGARA